jgi:phosphoglycerate kinase
MTVSTEDTIRWCSTLADDSDETPSLEDCLDAIPNLDSLDSLPRGTRVLVRGDTDVVVTDDGSIPNDVRIRSLVETLCFGGRRGWVQLVYGHRGRDPGLSLEPVARHLERLVPLEARGNRPVAFIGEWLDDQTGTVLASAARQVAELHEGTIAVLENTRRYSLEQALWKAGVDQITEMAPRLTNYVNSVAKSLAVIHVNEGFAASNRDLSSTLVPLGCQQVALGRYIDHELSRHVTRTRQADLVVFSGIKINKLDDLQQILQRKVVKTVIAAGGLALALKAAQAVHDGREFGLGLAADSTQAKIHIPPERIEQAGQMYRQGLEAKVEFVLPLDFILGDGSASATIPDGEAQFDVGPETRADQVAAVGRFLESHQAGVEAGHRPAIAFYNGVFGLFEEPAFETGTREFIGQLKRMTDAGAEVYVGGGEGGTALERYGQPDWVTHCFTAGGTILKALGNQPIPYIKALYNKTLGVRA